MKTGFVDLKPLPFPAMTWQNGQLGTSLNQLRDWAVNEVNAAIAWYQAKRQPARRKGQALRMGAILLGAIAGLAPILAELLAKDGVPGINPLWSTVAVAAAGTFVLLDKFYGYTNSWVRYLLAEMQLQEELKRFYCDWELDQLGWNTPQPTSDQAVVMVKRCQRFLLQAHTVIAQETQAWVAEFRSVLRQLDEAAKAAVRVKQPGAISVSVTNGDQCAGGWQLSVDGGAARSHSGRECALGDMQPGLRIVRAVGAIQGQPKQAEKAVLVAAGEIAKVELALA
jgi:hypothetical protein